MSDSDRELLRGVARRLVAFRKAAGLTQESMAESADIAASYAAHLESGSRQPTFSAWRVCLGSRCGDSSRTTMRHHRTGPHRGCRISSLRRSKGCAARTSNCWLPSRAGCEAPNPKQDGERERRKRGRVASGWRAAAVRLIVTLNLLTPGLQLDPSLSIHRRLHLQNARPRTPRSNASLISAALRPLPKIETSSISPSNPAAALSV